MSENSPQTVICRYKVKAGKEAEMEQLLRKHWPALREVGLVTDEPARIYRGLPSGKPGGTHGAASTYIEIFQWKTPRSSEMAHQTPQVMAVWEPMGAICDDMDFPHYEPLDLS